MKNLKTIFITAITGMFIGTASAQDTTISIKTSAQCGSCKKRLENGMSFEKGVSKVVLDLETKELKLTYNKKKTSPQSLKKAISDIGYDADEMPANEKAYNKLPKCCQKGGHE